MKTMQKKFQKKKFFSTKKKFFSRKRCFSFSILKIKIFRNFWQNFGYFGPFWPIFDHFEAFWGNLRKIFSHFFKGSGSTSKKMTCVPSGNFGSHSAPNWLGKTDRHFSESTLHKKWLFWDHLGPPWKWAFFKGYRSRGPKWPYSEGRSSSPWCSYELKIDTGAR